MGATKRSIATSEGIRNAVVDLLVAEGPLGFTMEKLASVSCSSIGSVYSRYGDRDASWRDAAEMLILPGMAEILRSGEGRSLLEQLEKFRSGDDADRIFGGFVMLAIAERTAPFDEPKVGETCSAIAGMFNLPHGDTTLSSGVRYALLAWLVGARFLGAAGCVVPRIEDSLALLVEEILYDPKSARPQHRSPNGVVDWQPPSTPIPRVNDEIAEMLVDATRRTAAMHGVAHSSVQDIAAESGMTTGAIYRRYPSKRGLLLDTMMRELKPERYAWTQRFLVALLDQSSHDHPGDVLTDQMLSLINDPITLGSHTELIAAALADGDMRAVLVDQFVRAAGARRKLFEDLKSHDVFQPGTDSELLAWLLQAVPLGARILQSAGIECVENDLRHTIRRMIDVV